MSAKAVAQRAARTIDWDYLARAVVSDEGRRELSALRRTYDDVSNTLETKLSQKPVAINWDLYKEKLPPKIVDIFKKSFESISIPEYEDKFTPDFEKKHAQLVAKALEDEEVSKKELVKLKAELEKVQAQKEALKSQTVDDYFAKNPQLKEKIDDEIKSQNWGY